MLHFLSREERYRCDRQCDAVLSDAMAALVAFDGEVDASEWRVIGRRDQFAVHRATRSAQGAASGGAGAGGGGNGARVNILASGFLRGSLAQIAEGLSAETDEELLTTEALLSGAHVRVTAAAVLNVAERPSVRARFRFAGVKWYAWTRAAGAGTRVGAEREGDDAREPRELLAYERMGVLLDDDDREVAYHVVRSLDRPEWPLFVARAPGLRRADLALCFLFRAVADDLAECLVVGSYQARTSSAAQRAADVLVAERVLNASRALRSYEAKKLSRLMDKARDRPVTMSRNCLRCGARRTVLDPLRNCGLCKKSVCSACRQSKRVFRLDKHRCEPETEVFCAACLKRAHLPSAAPRTEGPERAPANAKKQRPRRSKAEAEPEPRPAGPDYMNYDRLIERYAERRHSITALGPRSGRVSASGSSSGSQDGASRPSAASPPAAVAMPDQQQLLALRRERETLLSFPIARTVVHEDLYLPPGGEGGASQAEEVFRRHRELQEQLEQLVRPNPLHLRLLEEQERRRARRSEGVVATEPAAAPARRRAMTVPSHEPVASRASARPPATAASADTFLSDLYARF